MSQSDLQVLLHAGELCHIVQAIHDNNGKFVGGSLFGLWRNSLKQPVIQFVTGPLASRKPEMESIFNNKGYNVKCRDILFKDHAMLKLGYWFSGSEEERNEAKSYFDKNANASLLLYISFTGGELRGEFFLKKDDIQDHGSLCKEDVLLGQSSFRLFDKLTKQIKDAGAKYSTQFADEKLQHVIQLVEKFPSRIQVRDPETKEEQWYSSEDGVALLQAMVASLAQVSIEVDMSRDATTHNIQFNINDGYCLDFPENFPKGMPILCNPRGQRIPLQYDYDKQPDYGRIVVDALRLYFQSGSTGQRDHRR